MLGLLAMTSASKSALPQELSCAEGWHSQKVGDYCNTCCLDQESSLVKAAKAKAVPACWLICANENLQCPPNMYLKQNGDCYTCCVEIGELGSSLVSPAQTPFRMCKDL
ncbi:hypothetical protein MSAN_01109200 [Mycena sanguinolenta]|uniref:Uncharacterized protein n=1 Tax=Mycena sanguinolenta TaxID=230812 RepID=A0A8H6YQQ1_9AGAR|nr:hypothetical protein MSAN_01109200 [Mycena sanguinolenta]